MTVNPYMARKAREGNGAHGVKSERKTAKRLDAQQSRFSGSRPNQRGDMYAGQFMVEAKATSADSYRLELDLLCKTAGEALQENKIPAVAITFVTGDGNPRPNGNWVAIRESDFKALREGLED